jgi:hypothetical protein
LIGAARIARACRARHVQEVIFHSREADVAKRVIAEADRRAARAGTYAPAEPVKRSSNQVCHSRALRLPARNRDSARPGLDLGRRERRIVTNSCGFKIPPAWAISSAAAASAAGRRLDRDGIPRGDGHELANFR